jgi:transposase InsO family protein
MLYIRKSSGEKQRFNLHKFRRSLLKAGAQEKDITTIIHRIKKEKPKSTQRIHEIATEMLQKQNPPVADRYNLKRALMELGPHGYPFEKFVAHLFSLQSYKTETNRVVPGACVDHEVDIVANKNNHHYMIECKFHNRIGMKSDVKVTLYVQARFEDIRDAWEQKEHGREEYHQAWVATNTQFTSEAIRYGECKNMQLLGWGYPAKDSLAELIQKYDLFPITTLTSLTKYQKRTFLKKGLVLCKDARSHKKMLENMGLKPREIQKIISEAEAVCKL